MLLVKKGKISIKISQKPHDEDRSSVARLCWLLLFVLILKNLCVYF